MFREHVLIMRRSKLHYTASGIITPIGGHMVKYWDKYTEMHGQQNGKITFFVVGTDKHLEWVIHIQQIIPELSTACYVSFVVMQIHIKWPTLNIYNC